MRPNSRAHSVCQNHMAVTVWHIISSVVGAVQVSLRAVFSKYSITPARALNFGPVVYNSTAGPRTVEVTNVGEVPVNLRLFDPAKGLVCCISPYCTCTINHHTEYGKSALHVNETCCNLPVCITA